MSKDISKIIDDIDQEIMRSKMFVNQAGYANNSAVNLIVRRYRTELKQLRAIMNDDRNLDGLTTYE